jgi:hypothetical protein
MKVLAVALALTWALAGAALAEDGRSSRSIRLIGEAPGAVDPAPQKFVLDLELAQGDSAFQSEVTGWFAALPPAIASGEISGTCVRGDCALSVDLDNAKLSLTGDIAGPAAPAAGRYVLTDDDSKTTGEGAVRFSPVAGPIGDLGALAAPGAVGAAELRDLLIWAGVDQGFSNADKTEPDDIELDGLAEWQQSQGKPMTGLIFASDLAALRAQAEAAKAAAGWTPFGDDKLGWSAAYPSRLLPKASQSGGEHRFLSADGRASLVVAFDPPMSDDQFSALVDKLTSEPGHDHQNYTRVNGDMELTYVEKGMTVSTAYHNRASGLGRLVFSRPMAADKTYALFDAVLPESLKVKDDGPDADR